MLDESLPTFILKASRDSVKQDATIYLAQYGEQATPAYTLRKPDPASPDARNKYAAAVADCYNHEILYGEVLVEPEWTQPTLSAEEVRRQATLVSAGPQPLLPSKVALQLYNPDQQITLHHSPSKWNAGEQWTFELPQQTFRQPSASSLDHGQDDPGAHEATPTIALKWKRDGKLSKDFVMYLDGQARDSRTGKKKQKEPDIPLAFFRSFRELTVYEPNLTRLDVEDPKGFEVVSLLAAVVIRDIYHGPLSAVFNISDAAGRPMRRSSAEARLQPSAAAAIASTTALPLRPVASSSQVPTLSSIPPSQIPPAALHSPTLPNRAHAASQPPPANPRTQWEIDAETARLRRQVEAEERDQAKRQKEAVKQARRAEKESERLAKQVAEEEEAAARRRQADIERETERLRRQVEAEQKAAKKKGKNKHRASDAAPPPLPPRHPNAPPTVSAPPTGAWPPNSAWAQQPPSGAPGGYGALGGGSGALYPPGSGGFAGQRPLSSDFLAPQYANNGAGSSSGGGFFGWGRSRELSPPQNRQNKLHSKRSSLF